MATPWVEERTISICVLKGQYNLILIGNDPFYLYMSGFQPSNNVDRFYFPRRCRWAGVLGAFSPFLFLFYTKEIILFNHFTLTCQNKLEFISGNFSISDRSVKSQNYPCAKSLRYINATNPASRQFFFAGRRFYIG